VRIVFRLHSVTGKRVEDRLKTCPAPVESCVSFPGYIP
jgi:hypothetical protein